MILGSMVFEIFLRPSPSGLNLGSSIQLYVGALNCSYIFCSNSPQSEIYQTIKKDKSDIKPRYKNSECY